MFEQLEASASVAASAPPEIQVMPIWHQYVHGFVAWSALLSLTYFVLMPAVLFL